MRCRLRPASRPAGCRTPRRRRAASAGSAGTAGGATAHRGAARRDAVRARASSRPIWPSSVPRLARLARAAAAARAPARRSPAGSDAHSGYSFFSSSALACSLSTSCPRLLAADIVLHLAHHVPVPLREPHGLGDVAGGRGLLLLLGSDLDVLPLARGGLDLGAPRSPPCAACRGRTRAPSAWRRGTCRPSPCRRRTASGSRPARRRPDRRPSGRARSR